MATVFTIVNKKSGKVLDVKDGSTADAAPVQQYSKNTGLGQRWILDPDISTVVNDSTTNSLDFVGTELTSTVNGKQATVDIGSIIADVLYIQTGTAFNGYLENTDWTLNTGSGERTYKVSVKFDSPFRFPPQVSLSISGQDVGNSKNTRVQVMANNITVDGFELTYRTWFDTTLFSVWASWTAIGLKP
jgi:hypothetical protein